MKITYQTVDLERKEIDLKNCVNLRINGIQIKEQGKGIVVSTDEKISIRPNASNSITINNND